MRYLPEIVYKRYVSWLFCPCPHCGGKKSKPVLKRNSCGRAETGQFIIGRVGFVHTTRLLTLSPVNARNLLDRTRSKQPGPGSCAGVTVLINRTGETSISGDKIWQNILFEVREPGPETKLESGGVISTINRVEKANMRINEISKLVN